MLNQELTALAKVTGQLPPEVNKTSFTVLSFFLNALNVWRPPACASHLKQHSAVSVHVGPGVLGLALLQQHVGHDLVELGHQLEHGVVGKMLQSKFTLAGVAGVGLPQHGVAVTWNHLQPRQREREREEVKHSHLVRCHHAYSRCIALH